MFPIVSYAAAVAYGAGGLFGGFLGQITDCGRHPDMRGSRQAFLSGHALGGCAGLMLGGSTYLVGKVVIQVFTLKPVSFYPPPIVAGVLITHSLITLMHLH